MISDNRKEKLIKKYKNEPEFVDLIELFLNEITELKRELTEVKLELTEVKQENKTLKDRLNQNSRNSSKPPSSDGFNKPKPKSRRKKSGKSSGGQKGHKGHFLEMKDEPDCIVTHSVSACQACGHDLEGISSESYKRRQIYELIAKLEVTEHQAETMHCPHCRYKNQASFPDEVPYSVQYGSNFKSFVSYLDVYQLLPSARISELLKDLTGQTVSEGTLYNTNQKLSEQLLPFEEQVKQELIASPVVNFDESGLRVQGKNNWLHSAGTDQLTHYTIDPKRGKDGMDEAGILPAYQGIAVHDGWRAYYRYEDCQHALCNVHHERDLRATFEQNGQEWAKDMIDLLYEIKTAVEAKVDINSDQLDPEQISRFESSYDAIIQQGLAENPTPPPPKEKKRGRRKQSKAKNLLDRLDKHRDSVLFFMRNFQVPFTNNQAEQDVRMIKVQQKVSGGFRSTTGTGVFCRIRSYISTLKKQGKPVMENIQNAFNGNPFIPK